MKKFFLTAILIFIVAISSIASAADFNSVDWSKAPTFTNKADFARYIQKCEANCMSSVPVKFKGGLFVDTDEVLMFVKNTQTVDAVSANYFDGIRVLYQLHLSPGVKVAYAYRTKNTSILNNDERQLYNVAVEIVEKAARKPTPIMKEFYIHDEITARVEWYNTTSTSKTPRHGNAIGALVDGRATCQGYSDAFYMLGTMLGLKVGKMSGVTRGTKHIWNTITFDDGKIYAVDCTWDDASFSTSKEGGYNNYIYFNAAEEILNVTHSWSSATEPQLVQKIDNRYFYFAPESTNIVFYEDKAEDALYKIAERIAKEDFRLSWGMSKFEQRYNDKAFVLNRLTKEILPKKFKFKPDTDIRVDLTRRGQWLFFIVDAKKRK